MSDARTYPYVDGPHLILGPECFTGDGQEVAQDVISWRGSNYRLAPERSSRTWVGEALAAFDQAIVTAGNRDEHPDAGFWVSRAQAAAAIASAEQARAANLIAWKQLQVSRSATQDGGIDLMPSGGDVISDEIERLLGLA